jgi:hypothetical protein
MKRVLPIRIPVYINTKVVANGNNFDGIIGNLSHNGAFLEIDPAKTVTHFIPRKRLDLKFQGDSKKTLTLKCEIIWLYTKRNSSNTLTNSIGVEIINPSPAYKKYFKTL